MLANRYTRWIDAVMLTFTYMTNRFEADGPSTNEYGSAPGFVLLKGSFLVANHSLMGETRVSENKWIVESGLDLFWRCYTNKG